MAGLLLASTAPAVASGVAFAGADAQPAGTVASAATIPVSLGVADFGRILVDPATSHIFVSSPGSSAIVVLDFDGNIVKTVTNEAGAWGMAIQGHTLYVVLNTMGWIDRIDTGTLTETGMLVNGLVRPRDLILAGGKLWTTTGNCAQGAVQLVSVDPSATTPTMTTYPNAFNGNNGLSYCAAFASNPTANPSWFLAWDPGLDPADVTTFGVSSGVPVQLQSARENNLGNLQDVAINPDGKTFITASGAPYEFDEWKVSDLSQDGIVYPANAYPTAVATTPARGGIMGGGLNGLYDPDFYAYAIGQPAAYLTRVDFGGTSNTVPSRGVALSPDGNTAFVISGSSTLNYVPIPVPGAPGPPTSVTATPGSRSATVSWTAPTSLGGSPISNYTVTSHPNAVSVSTNSAATSITVAPLTAGTIYFFTVTATNALGTSVPSAQSNGVVPTGPPPGAPTSVTATAGDSSATVSWTAPTDAGGSAITAYVITPYVGSTAQPTTSVNGSPPPTSAVVNGLMNNQTYTFTVAAVNAWGQGSASAPSNAVTPVQGIPGQPTGVTATAGVNAATVLWNAPQKGQPISSYTVTSNPGNLTVITNGSTFSAKVAPLTADVSYTFTVTATNAVGTGQPSAPSPAVVPTGPPPGPPTNVNAQPGDGAAFVSWAPPTDTGGQAITGYQVTPYVQGTPQTPTNVSGSTPNTVVTGLNNGLTYTFTVAAVTRWGVGAASAQSNPVTPIQGGNYHPLAPARILDTRDGTGVPTAGRLGPGGMMSVQISGRGGVPSTGVSAVVLNVTVTNTTAGSYLTVWPARIARPLASNMNWTAGKTVPNLVEVALGPGGQVSVYNAAGSTDVIFDIEGWIGDASNSVTKDGLFVGILPHRVLDTRNGTGVPAAVPVGQGRPISVKVTDGTNVPLTGVEAVVLNVTVTNATAGSYLTVYPTGGSPPYASNLNFLAGQTVPNRVIVKLGTDPFTSSYGWVSFSNAAGSVDVIADVSGWFTDSSSSNGGARFTGTLPTRIFDSRDPGNGPLGPGQTGTLQLTDQNGNPVTGVSAIVVNVTVTNPTAPSYLSLWPNGFVQPFASDLNYTPGLTVANLVVLELGPNASFNVYNAAGSTDVIIDLVGYYGSPQAAPSVAMRALPLHASLLRRARP